MSLKAMRERLARLEAEAKNRGLVDERAAEEREISEHERLFTAWLDTLTCDQLAELGQGEESACIASIQARIHAWKAAGAVGPRTPCNVRYVNGIEQCDHGCKPCWIRDEANERVIANPASPRMRHV
jgi:hypothetical protein